MFAVQAFSTSVEGRTLRVGEMLDVIEPTDGEPFRSKLSLKPALRDTSVGSQQRDN